MADQISEVQSKCKEKNSKILYINKYLYKDTILLKVNCLNIG